MKTTRYRFEQAVQEVREDTTEWLRDEFRSILESNKDFTRKADYIGFSILSIDNKIASIDEEINELQALKKKLESAKEIAVRTGASVLSEYGIDRLEGAGISSISITKELVKDSQKIEILNEAELIKAGYYQKVVDEDAVLEADSFRHRRELISNYYKITTVDTSSPAKLKINKRRSSAESIESLAELIS